MKLDQLTKSILKSILTLACITLFLIFLIKAKVVIIYILVSMVLTLMFSPFSSFLKSKLKFNNLFSSIASLLLLLVLIMALIEVGRFIYQRKTLF